MKINKDIISTHILISNFMKINQDIIATQVMTGTLTGFPYKPFKEALATILTNKIICFGNW